MNEEQKKAISKSRMGIATYSKKVVNTITKEVYPSAKIAAETINMKHGTLIAMLNGANPNKTNLKYLTL